jgi:hypothetical protein
MYTKFSKVYEMVKNDPENIGAVANYKRKQK